MLNLCILSHIVLVLSGFWIIFIVGGHDVVTVVALRLRLFPVHTEPLWILRSLTPFDMMAPQNVFDHCAQTLKRRKLKLGDF